MSTTGYEHMTDREFWTEVAELLTLIQRHGQPDASLADGAGALADYVHAEAERRDPDLAANARQRLAMIHAADDRAGNPLDLDTHFTPEEDADFDRLYAAYRERIASLAEAARHLDTAEQREASPASSEEN